MRRKLALVEWILGYAVAGAVGAVLGMLLAFHAARVVLW